MAKARAGDTILVYPRPQNAPYEKVALMVRKGNRTVIHFGQEHDGTLWLVNNTVVTPFIPLPTSPGEPQAKTPPPLLEYKHPLSTQPHPGFKSDANSDLGAFGRN